MEGSLGLWKLGLVYVSAVRKTTDDKQVQTLQTPEWKIPNLQKVEETWKMIPLGEKVNNRSGRDGMFKPSQVG